eukprot:CAMPEP_0175992170 /NCGR_PEP_ID=MMETSP0108-20121206/53249_1 /TAXON_ID=195067 ORGANISM="Goniomonas pacifica, Strain CCMP1869" /NCGR_SAMPLE_ID=MMETSP0108 /ASSEMBLY_ACC=CAM_ASM_000204 /LENGTH=87 /DNA_ID=CAMNT_0017323795 /DNA_START=88 /DNA_END=351 /DNA_ORIENTATION=-
MTPDASKRRHNERFSLLGRPFPRPNNLAIDPDSGQRLPTSKRMLLHSAVGPEPTTCGVVRFEQGVLVRQEPTHRSACVSRTLQLLPS